MFFMISKYKRFVNIYANFFRKLWKTLDLTYVLGYNRGRKCLTVELTMDTKNKSGVTNEELRMAFAGDTNTENSGMSLGGERAKNSGRKAKNDKRWLMFNIVGGVGLVAGVACILVGTLGLGEEKAKLDFPEIPSKGTGNATYSALTGEKLENAELLNAPAYCVQMPNGTDGARPQAGLTDAGVVFEAIAEAGITRFAAVYQDPSAAIIGPVRSLRIYYLQWDTPFNCTIVHAGGSGDALAAVSNGYQDLSEDYSYMYRGTYGGRLWNNLFTTSAYLKKFSSDHNYNTSEIKGFARLTPAESEQQRADESVKEKLDITKATSKDTSEVDVPVSTVSLNLGGWADFNVNYSYDAEKNTYARSYASGDPHEVYSCGAEDLGEKNPEDVCTLTQVEPSVVVAMVVQETKASDNYHEDITAVGSGDAYVFQNGTAIEGTWKKASAEDQIKFTDKDGREIKLAPGQTFITAVPNYGSVEYWRCFIIPD